MSTSQSAQLSSTLVMIGTGILLGCSLFWTVKYYWHRPPKIRKKKKKFVTPPWAIRKAKELEPPEMSKEDLEALEKRKPREMWNTVIFFPDMVPQRPDGSTKQLLHYFKEARVSIHLCMYLCSHVIFSDVIKDMYQKKGLLVQVVTEYDTWTAHNNFGLKCLEKQGIEVRLNTNGYMMHNKFAIIDEEAVLTGSLNWTKQGVTSNNENVMVTTDPRIVSKYVQEFNKLWKLCRRSDLI